VRFEPIPTALLALFLTGCAAPLSVPPTPISPSLMAPCPPHLPPVLLTWGDVAQGYAQALAELADCRSRHRALSDAAGGK
jgi:hypothetical protein